MESKDFNDDIKFLIDHKNSNRRLKEWINDRTNASIYKTYTDIAIIQNILVNRNIDLQLKHPLKSFAIYKNTYFYNLESAVKFNGINVIDKNIYLSCKKPELYQIHMDENFNCILQLKSFGKILYNGSNKISYQLIKKSQQKYVLPGVKPFYIDHNITCSYIKGDVLFIGTLNKGVRIFDLVTGQEIDNIGPQTTITCLYINNNYVFIGDALGYITVCNRAGGFVRSEYNGHSIISINYFNNDQLVITTPTSISLFDINKLKSQDILHCECITASFQSDEWLFCGTEKGEVFILNINSKKIVWHDQKTCQSVSGITVADNILYVVYEEARMDIWKIGRPNISLMQLYHYFKN